jgi:hypothetical protein
MCAEAFFLYCLRTILMSCCAKVKGQRFWAKSWQLMEKREQDIEHSYYRGQAALDVGFEAMMHVLETADDGDHRQSGFHTHAFIPGALLTELEIVRDASRTAKADIGQHNADLPQRFDQVMEVLVMGVHGGPIPVDDLTLLIEQPAQLDAHAPASFVFALLAHLLGTTPLTDGKDQFKGISVDDRKEAGISQQATKPVLMGLQLSGQACAVRQTGKKGLVIALEPAGEGPKMASLESKQDANRHQFARIELGLTVLGHGSHPIIDKAKNLYDNVLGCHEVLRSFE